MAVPKQKLSRTRRDNRRGANKLQAIIPAICPQCGEAKLPHRVCGACGFYKDKKIMEVSGAK